MFSRAAAAHSIHRLSNPDHQGTRISRAKYGAVRAAILDSVRALALGLAFADLSAEVERRVLAPLFENASMAWYTVTVRLDLEARGMIKGPPGSGPRRLVRLAQAG